MAVEKKSDKRRKEEEKTGRRGKEERGKRRGSEDGVDKKDVNGGRVHARGEREKEK